MKEKKKQSYASALRQVVPGKSIGLPNASKGGVLRICLRGIHQAECEMTADRLKSDFESMRSVLKHLAVESKGTRLNRFGQHDNLPKIELLFFIWRTKLIVIY